MVPLPAIIWNKIAFPMQLFGSFLTEKVVALMGIPILREGNILYLTNTTLEVVDACSGLRSLTTLFALSAVFAILSSHTTTQKWILFLTAAPIAIFANIVRLTGTAILASKYGGDVAQGFLHDFSGIAVFVVGVIMLATVSNLIKRI
jgi:exosortase